MALHWNVQPAGIQPDGLAHCGDLLSLADGDFAVVFAAPHLACQHKTSHVCNFTFHCSSVLFDPALRGQFDFILGGIFILRRQPVDHGAERDRIKISIRVDRACGSA